MNATSEIPLNRLMRKPRHKWFSAPSRLCDNGWFGPHDTIEAAVTECARNYDYEGPIFVGQGYKLSRAEFVAEYAWEVDTENAIEVRLAGRSRTDSGS